MDFPLGGTGAPIAPLAYFAGVLGGADLAPIGRGTDVDFALAISAYVPIFALATLGFSRVVEAVAGLFCPIGSKGGAWFGFGSPAVVGLSTRALREVNALVITSLNLESGSLTSRNLIAVSHRQSRYSDLVI